MKPLQTHFENRSVWIFKMLLKLGENMRTRDPPQCEFGRGKWKIENIVFAKVFGFEIHCLIVKKNA